MTEPVVFNIRNLKLAKLFVGDLAHIIKIFENTITELNTFSKYKPVGRSLVALNSELETLRSYEKDCESIIQSKGKVKTEKKESE